MKAKILKENLVEIGPVKDLNIHQIFSSGQTFRFQKNSSQTWEGIAFGRYISFSQKGDSLFLFPCTKKEFETIWYGFFDLGTDYGKIKNKLKKENSIFEKAISVGGGIRILRQDPWETLISFIISSNNNIPRIKKSVDCICEKYGNPISLNKENELYYDFPMPKALAQSKLEDLRLCGMGYRDRYVKATAEKVVKEGVLGKNEKNYSSEMVLNRLLSFPGVGRKVADCVRLFAYGHKEAFPLDTWMKKAVNTLDIAPGKKDKDIHLHAKEAYGELSGIAQQYLFYYMRHLSKA